MGPVPSMLDLVERVAAMAYMWPAPPDPAAARASGTGSCSSKHALLREELWTRFGIASRPLFTVGPLVPAVLAGDPDISPGVGLLEVHECLTVSVPGVGPCLVDVTWDPPLLDAGLPGTRRWDGRSDMTVAVGHGIGWWAPDVAHLRAEKEALRSRLYTDRDRDVRDTVLGAMSQRFQAWRSA